jgi:exodeoxyribonuclease VII small subunit
MDKEKEFEELLEIAKKYLEELNKPDITLSQSITNYKKGIQILEEAQKKLDNAKLQFQELDKSI